MFEFATVLKFMMFSVLFVLTFPFMVLTFLLLGALGILLCAIVFVCLEFLIDRVVSGYQSVMKEFHK